jgi:hypothetical protein
MREPAPHLRNSPVPPSEPHVSSGAESTAQPLISIVLTGRNDGYGGDFTARFHRTLRFNHCQLAARQIAHEILFVEWAPPRNAPYLFDLTRSALPEIDWGVVSWYIVDPRYHDALSLNPRLEYLEFLAKNVAIRRARGRFVLTSNCDVYLGRRVLDVVKRNALQPGIVYRAPRFDIKFAADYSSLDWDVLEDPRNLDGPPKQLKPPFMGGGTGDFVLLDRQSFHEIRGFNEIYRAARIGIDHNVLVKALSSGLAIEDIGGPVYHINHVGSYRLTADVYAGREAEAPWGDSRWHSRGVVYSNPDAWGLSEAPMRQGAERQWHLDFSWNAVPPLVDLKRVVLPAARPGGPSPGRYVSR